MGDNFDENENCLVTHWDFLCSDPSNLNLIRWKIFKIFSFVAIDIDKITILRTKLIKLTWEIILMKIKNLPGGATVAKYLKQILKLIYLHYLTAPRGAGGIKRIERT